MDLEAKVIPIIGELSSAHEDFTDQCIQEIKVNKIKKVLLEINSIGGNSQVAANIYLKLKRLKNEGVEFNSVGTGYVQSGALLLLLLGTTRELKPHTKVMYHQHGLVISFKEKVNSRRDLRISLEKEVKALKIIEETNKKIDQEITNITGIDAITLKILQERVLKPSEAVFYNIATAIIE